MKTIEKLRNPAGKVVTLSRGRFGRDDHASYVMQGPTGTHCLAVTETETDRLRAHWNGFCSLNDVTNAEQRAEVADPKLIDASRCTERELARCRYLLAAIESRIEAEECVALNFRATWGNHGDAEHLRQQLHQIVEPDPSRAMLDEIDAEIGDLETMPLDYKGDVDARPVIDCDSSTLDDAGVEDLAHLDREQTS
jgi:hypothetical protein